MKKVFTLVVIIMSFSALNAQDTIVGWHFHNGTNDSLVDVANSVNATAFIQTVGGTSDISYSKNGSEGSPDKCAQTGGWHNGDGLKYWMIEFNSTGCESLMLSSKMRGGNNPSGPLDWKIQYAVGTGSWMDVPNGEFDIANNWSEGKITNLALPADCNDTTASIKIRWIMTSNLNLDSNAVDSAAITKIDDIYITGSPVSGINENEAQIELSVFPNPASDILRIKCSSEIKQMRIIALNGQHVFESMPSNKKLNINISELRSAIYFVSIIDEDNNIVHKTFIKK